MTNIAPNLYREGTSGFNSEVFDPLRYLGGKEFYEPAVLWDVVQVRGSENTLYGPGRIKFDTTHFKAQQYGITITHILMDAIGYTLDSTSPLVDGAAITDPLRFRNARDILDLATLQISRTHVRNVVRRPLTLSVFPGMSRPAGHSMEYWDPSNPGPALSSGQTQVCRFDFDRPFVAPHGYGVEFCLGAINNESLDVPALDAVKASIPKWATSFNTWIGAGRRFKQHAKHFSGELSYLAATQVPFYQPDGFGRNPALVVGVDGVSPELFPPNSRMNPGDFDAQEMNRGGNHTFFTGFSVMIDQKEYDTLVSNQPVAAGSVGGMPVAPLASRIPTKAKIAHGGTDRQWWRPGAPLSLVCPQATPAHVHTLTRPITLAPGERFSVELEVPSPVTDEAGAILFDPAYQIGVSFCGYRTIVPEKRSRR